MRCNFATMGWANTPIASEQARVVFAIIKRKSTVVFAIKNAKRLLLKTPKTGVVFAINY